MFTPTEGAAIGTVMTFVTALLRGGMRPQAGRCALLPTAQTSGMIFLIFMGADMMNAALALSQLPAELAAAVGPAGDPAARWSWRRS